MKFNWLFAIAAILFFTSCEEDGGIINPGDDGPSVTLESGPGLITSSVDLQVGQNFAVRVNASSTDFPMKTFSVQKDGVNIPASDIAINGSIASANPKLLFDGDRDAFVYDVSVRVNSAESFADYAFIVTDDNQNASSKSVTVNSMSTPASLDLNGAGASGFTVGTNALLQINVTAMAGSADIDHIAVYEDGSLVMPLSRLTYDQTPFDANPFSIPSEDAQGFDKPVFVRTPMTTGPMTYAIEITDIFGVTTSESFMVTVGTEVTALMGVLFNAGGDTGTGGLDLDTGNGTGSSDAAADIKDEGINTDLPVASNWIQKISGANGSVLRALVPGQNGLSESFTFGSIASSETVAALFDNGVALTETNASGEPTTDVIEMGDMFAVQNGDAYYIFKVAEVNVVTDSNDDSYTLDIKF